MKVEIVNPKKLAPCAAVCLALAAAGCGSGRHADGASESAQVQASGRHYEAARAAIAEGDTQRAGREVKLALSENPLDAKSHYLLGCLLEANGDHEQAVVAFQRAVAIDPTNSDAIYNLGTMLLWRGEVVPASQLLEGAARIRPDHVPTWNNLGKAYYQAGLAQLAVAAYEEALSRDPFNEVALKNLLFLAEAAGHTEAAATYRRRLEASKSADGRADLEAKDLAATLPVWPVAAAMANVPANIDPAAAPAAARADGGDAEVDALRELLCDLPHVQVGRRGGRIAVTGWTSSEKERATLDRILAMMSAAPGSAGAALPSEIIDLTSDDTGDPHRMVEVDAVLFIANSIENQSEGFNLLDAINLTFNYFATDSAESGTGFTAPPDITGTVFGLSQQSWIFGASVDYVVNIANAADDRIAVLARPHLTTLSGTPAKFLAGGELVYKVAGNVSGDIKPYPFGTTLIVTPTLLRTPNADGGPRIRLVVEAGRTSVLSLLDSDPDQPTAFDKVSVTSEAVLDLGQTLILSGLSQRESRTGREGVPILMDIPVLRLFFSQKTSLESNTSVIILLTPRDPAYWDQKNQKANERFVEMRRAFLRARQGTPEDMQRFREQYPESQQMPPNRFGSHFFLVENSEIYRSVSGQEMSSDDVDLELLGPRARK